jgi:hypothetical protein
MGIRGEIFSTTVSLQNRTYFFNVKENRLGDLYLNIVESKNKDTGGFERQSVILFADDLSEFLKGFDDSLRVLEKAVKEKRKTAFGGSAPPRRSPPDDGAGTRPPRKGSADEAARGKKRYTGKTSGTAPRPSSRPASGGGARGKPKASGERKAMERKPRKVVVRKRDRDD